MSTSPAHEAEARKRPIFVIRLWQEAFEDDSRGHHPSPASDLPGPTEWRGEVRNIVSGEVRYFRDWATLAELLPRMLADSDLLDSTPPDGDDSGNWAGKEE
ncbi:MAG: hypothetical protein WDZ49_10260 [Litorilinea sp.]